jgi:hypothetical protein
MGDRKQSIDFYNAAVRATKDQSYKDWATHAFGLFNSACLADPGYGKAMYWNGNNCGDLGRFYAAIASYRRALRGELDIEDRIHCLSNLSWRLHQVGELEECLKVAQEAIEAGPRHAYAWVNLSIGYGGFGDRKNCRAAAEKAYELDPEDTTVQFNMAFALMFDEEYADGLKFFEARFAVRLKHYETYPYPKWLGDRDKVVFLVADQGLGDTLSFSRFIPQACQRARYIHAMVQPPLLRAFNHAFMNIRNLNIIPTSNGFPDADVWTTFVSLPFALGLSNEEIKAAPHPKLPVGDVSQHWKVPDAKLHIGVQWGGAALNDIDKWRTFSVQHLLDLYKVPGIQLYSMQCDDHRTALISTASECLIRDLSPWIQDITDTCAILQHLDMVICCESALAHIAGALDKETWIAYSNHAHDYRLGHDGTAILWYKKHRLFTQGRDRSWETCFHKIIEALQEKVGA